MAGSNLQVVNWQSLVSQPEVFPSYVFFFLLVLGSPPNLKYLLKLFHFTFHHKNSHISIRNFNFRASLETLGHKRSFAAGQCCCAVCPTAQKLQNLGSYILTHLFVLSFSSSFDKELFLTFMDSQVHKEAFFQSSGGVLPLHQGNGVTISSYNQNLLQNYYIFAFTCLRVYKIMMFIIKL